MALVDTRAGLDVVRRKNCLYLRDSNFDRSVVQPLVIRYTDCAIPNPAAYCSLWQLLDTPTSDIRHPTSDI
jgi:hypothetical protein